MLVFGSTSFLPRAAAPGLPAESAPAFAPVLPALPAAPAFAAPKNSSQ